MTSKTTNDVIIDKKERYFGIMLVLVGMMSWPLAFGMGKLVFLGYPHHLELTLICYLVFFRGIMLYFIGEKLLYNRGEYIPFKEVLKHPDAKSSILLGCIGIMAAISSFMAVAHMTVKELIIIILMAPFIVNVGRPIFLKQKFQIMSLVATALAMVGALIAMDLENQTSESFIKGFGMAFLGVLFMSAYILMGHKFTQRNRTLGISLAGISNMIMAVVVLIVGNLTGLTQGYVLDFAGMPWQDYAMLFIIAILTVKGLVVSETGFRRISAVLGSTVLYLELFWAAGVDYMLFNTMASGPVYVGMTVLLLAAVFDMYANRKSGKFFS